MAGNGGRATAVGVDVGATLAKIALRTPGNAVEFRFEPAAALDRVAALLAEIRPGCLGLTGGGAAELARRVDLESVAVNEFAAWGAGASEVCGRVAIACR